MKILKWLAGLIALLVLLEITGRANRYVVSAIEQGGIPLSRYAIAIATFFVIGTAVSLIELAAPRSLGPRRYARGITFSLIYVIGIALVWPWIEAMRRAIPGTPLVALYLKDGPPATRLALASLFLLGHALLFDFLFYWFHRAQHRWNWLWRVHRVHHSLNPMNGLNSYHHILDEVIRIPVVTLPVLALIQIDMPHVFALSAFMGTWGYFIHSDTSLNLGPLHGVINDNTTHRLHHSVRPEHMQCNFGAMFTIWDRIFGTYQEPTEEWPDVGVIDMPPPASLKDYLLLPFR